MKKIFDEKRNKEDEIGLIVLSHGPLAISLYESAKMIYGDVENATALSLGYGDEISAYVDEIEKAINFYKKGCVILIDLFGGTPFNQTLLYLKKNNIENVIAYTGANLPLLITALTLRNGIDSSIESIKNGIDCEMDNYVKDITNFFGDDSKI